MFFEYQQELIIVLTSFLLIATTRWLFKFYFGDKYLRIGSGQKRHDWTFNETLTRVCRCSQCDILIAGEGYTCEICGLSSDIMCLQILEQSVPCKKITLPSVSDAMKHHWVKVGNVLLVENDYTCVVCDDNEVDPDLQCCWCQKGLHESCMPAANENCDFGEFRPFIVPPYSVGLMKSSRIYRKMVLKSVKPPNWASWMPVIVVTNRQSGNNDGSIITSSFRRILNPCQVIDLAMYKPETIVHWCNLLPDVKFTILVGGGDGTVSWILNTIQNANLKISPTVGVIPLGTGNDLSRALGWGAAYTRDIFPCSYLRAINDSENIHIDRWRICTRPSSHHQFLRYPRGYKTLEFYNYFSLGVDAKVTLDFHQTRQSGFYLFKTRLFNKLLYFIFGTQQAVDPDCKGLEKKIDLFVDDVKIDLPEVESLVLLNISSWAAGIDLWKMCRDNDASVDEQKLDDGKIEIVALYSSFHIAQLKMGLSVPHCIGQGSDIKIIFKQDIPVQADGEPWIQHPGILNIKHINYADVTRTNYFSK